MPRLPRTEYVPTYKMYLCKFASAQPGKTVPNSAVNKTQTTVFDERMRARLGLAMTGRMCRIKRICVAEAEHTCRKKPWSTIVVKVPQKWFSPLDAAIKWRFGT